MDVFMLSPKFKVLWQILPEYPRINYRTVDISYILIQFMFDE